MNTQNKEVTALVRSMKAVLKAGHNLDIPHSALRASYLQALGEHPHAFAGKASADTASLQAEVARLTELVKKAPLFFSPEHSFDGEKAAWLKAAGQPPAPVPGATARTLYLACDEAGCTELLALDKDGMYLLPDGTQFDADSQVVSQYAEVPSVRRYGLPEYLADPARFYQQFGLTLSPEYSAKHRGLGDDSGDSCLVTILMGQSQWELVLLTVLHAENSLRDDVAEWVGQHYDHNFDKMTIVNQLDWVQRFLVQSAQDSDDRNPQDGLLFEWVYPDEDGDSCPASVDLSTGVVTPHGKVPADVPGPGVRPRLRHDDWEEPIPVYFQRQDAGGQWRLTKKCLAEVKQLLA